MIKKEKKAALREDVRNFEGSVENHEEDKTKIRRMRKIMRKVKRIMRKMKKIMRKIKKIIRRMREIIRKMKSYEENCVRGVFCLRKE